MIQLRVSIGCVLQRYSVKYNTEWKFSPADGPWFNGATEALVKTVKRALNAAIGEQIMSFSELQTILFEVAQIVNQRPIGCHTSTPEDWNIFVSRMTCFLDGHLVTHPKVPFKSVLLTNTDLTTSKQLLKRSGKNGLGTFFLHLLLDRNGMSSKGT